ncbi:MAG: LysE family translocator [Solirubrobacteraceae bacterium]|nr:LysE family translocator [Solirubrobacteraceae bacterium]
MRSEVIAFAGVAALLTISPGADMALVGRRALGPGPLRDACLAALGISAGVIAWAALSAIGVAAILAASATAYTALKVAGGIYLVLLGLLAFRDARRTLRDGVAEEALAAESRSAWAAFREGLVTNLLNPKIAVFYTAVLPQFVAPGDPVLPVSLLLAGIHATLGIAWLCGYAWVLHRSRAVLGARARAAMQVVTGVVLLGLGGRVALDRG